MARLNNNTQMKSANNDAGKRKETLRELLLPVLCRCKERSLFKVRCACASSIHLCSNKPRVLDFCRNNGDGPLRKAHSYS